MSKRPLIGITTGLRTKHDEPEIFLPTRYIACVEMAGGTPVAIPILPKATMENLLNHLDGIVVIGGPDLPPDLYGEANQGCESLVPRERAVFDLALIRSAYNQNKPLLGICYGHQAVNVAFGGNLVQDIGSAGASPSRIMHRKLPHEDTAMHEIKLQPASRLAKILGAREITAASSHHQSVRQPGEGWQVVAHAPDRIIEATEYPARKFLYTVQWHPEMTPEAQHSKRLFRALVEAAREGEAPAEPP